MATLYIRRDTIGDHDDDAAERLRAGLERYTGHNVEWADYSGCNCFDRNTHRQDAQDYFESGEWW